MATLNQTACYAGEFLLAEEEVSASRENIVLPAGAALPAGQVLGKVTASGKYAAYNNAASDGTEVAAAILYAPADASAGDRRAVGIFRLASVVESKLTGLDAPGKVDLAAKFVICR